MNIEIDILYAKHVLYNAQCNAVIFVYNTSLLPQQDLTPNSGQPDKYFPYFMPNRNLLIGIPLAHSMINVIVSNSFVQTSRLYLSF